MLYLYESLLNNEEKVAMENSTIPYRVLNHNKGYIQLEVPSLVNKLSWSYLFKNNHPFQLPSGITDFRLNPLRGKISIEYEPEHINILDYIKKVASNPDVKRLLGKTVYEMPTPH
jgi:hypothetical protein